MRCPMGVTQVLQTQAGSLTENIVQHGDCIRHLHDLKRVDIVSEHLWLQPLVGAKCGARLNALRGWNGSAGSNLCCGARLKTLRGFNRSADSNLGIRPLRVATQLNKRSVDAGAGLTPHYHAQGLVIAENAPDVVNLCHAKALRCTDRTVVDIDAIVSGTICSAAPSPRHGVCSIDAWRLAPNIAPTLRTQRHVLTFASGEVTSTNAYPIALAFVHATHVFNLLHSMIALCPPITRLGMHIKESPTTSPSYEHMPTIV